MNKIIHRTQQFIFARQTSMISSTIILSTMMIVARFFGFLRYRILTGYFSVTELDIYFAAFRIPDLIFEVLITGALTTSLIPFFIKYKNNKEELSNNISSIINFISFALFILIVILMIFASPLMRLITPGFSEAKIRQVIFFSRVLLVGQLPFLVVGNFITGISQARKRFLIPALAPLIYNIAIIVVTALFAQSFHLEAPILGVIVGAFLFFVIQLPIIVVADFEYRVVIHKSKALWQFFRVAIPRIFTVITAQIEATVDLSLSSLVGSGSYAIFYLAQHLQLFPVSVIGIAFGQASLPYLTEIYQEKNPEDFKEIISESLLNLMYFTIPITAFFIFARTPLVRIFFGGNKFDINATNLTAISLSLFSLSLPFHAVYYFLTRCFYAVFDSRTPFYISIFSIALNAILSLYFILVLHLNVAALSLAFSIAMNTSVIILFIKLHKKLKGFHLRAMAFETSKMILASTIAAFIGFGFQRLLDGLIFDTSRTLNVFLLLISTATCHFLVYLFLSWVFNIREAYLIAKMLTRAKEYHRKIFEVYKGVE